MQSALTHACTYVVLSFMVECIRLLVIILVDWAIAILQVLNLAFLHCQVS